MASYCREGHQTSIPQPMPLFLWKLRPGRPQRLTSAHRPWSQLSSLQKHGSCDPTARLCLQSCCHRQQLEILQGKPSFWNLGQHKQLEEKASRGQTNDPGEVGHPGLYNIQPSHPQTGQHCTNSQVPFFPLPRTVRSCPWEFPSGRLSGRYLGGLLVHHAACLAPFDRRFGQGRLRVHHSFSLIYT